MATVAGESEAVCVWREVGGSDGVLVVYRPGVKPKG